MFSPILKGNDFIAFSLHCHQEVITNSDGVQLIDQMRDGSFFESLSLLCDLYFD